MCQLKVLRYRKDEVGSSALNDVRKKVNERGGGIADLIRTRLGVLQFALPAHFTKINEP